MLRSIDRRIRALALTLMTATLIAALCRPARARCRADPRRVGGGGERRIARHRHRPGPARRSVAVWGDGPRHVRLLRPGDLRLPAGRPADPHRWRQLPIGFVALRLLLATRPGQSPWRTCRRSRHLWRWVARRHLHGQRSRHQHADLGRQDPRDLRALPGLHRVPAHGPLGSGGFHGTGLPRPRQDIEATRAGATAACAALPGHPPPTFSQVIPTWTSVGLGPTAAIARLGAADFEQRSATRPAASSRRYAAKRVAGGRRSPHRMA